MLDADGKEWLFTVMRQYPEQDPDIADSFDDPMDAAKAAYKWNKESKLVYYFIEARPVIASVDCMEPNSVTDVDAAR